MPAENATNQMVIKDDLSLNHFAEQFQHVFRRADQMGRFVEYLRGLLDTTSRKTIDAIASATSELPGERKRSQSLHHFVSVSPWSYQQFLTTLLRYSQPYRVDPSAVWVVHDAVFVKKGRHSVGTMRQYARELGKKLNCQVAVFITQVGPQGVYPLAMQLYLPGSWLRSQGDSSTIPQEAKGHSSKSDIAQQLLEGLLTNGEMQKPVILETAYRNEVHLADNLHSIGLKLATNREHEIELALNGLRKLRVELGLDHFEGRSWLGWHHHVSLVMSAYHWRMAQLHVRHKMHSKSTQSVK